VPVEHHVRVGGKSNYTLKRLASYTLTMLTGFSTRPLRFASLIGVFATLLGVAMFVYVIARFAVQGTPVPGFPFLASAIAIFSGAQLLTLGIIGEYLARMHVRVMDQPPFAIRGATPPASTTVSETRTASARRSRRPAEAAQPAD
jgi:undecaprenyl-phosphate 4-deoxy-4-formamido-L-arabinose transferase